MHLRYHNQKSHKGHNRWDTVTQKLFINMLHRVAWNSHHFNSYTEMFFTSSWQFTSKQKNTNDFKFSSFWKMFGKCYDRFVSLFECQIRSTKCKGNPKTQLKLLLLLDHCYILIKMPNYIFNFSCIATVDKSLVLVYTWASKVAFDRFAKMKLSIRVIKSPPWLAHRWFVRKAGKHQSSSNLLPVYLGG